MSPDKFQQAWQTDSAQARVTVNADRLLSEVQRHQQGFRATIFWRDFREVVFALLMIPTWIYLGYKFSTLWTFYLTVPALIFVAGFMLVDRVLHRRRSIDPNEPLLPCVKESLTEVEHQIQLLRRIFWWYLLPPAISIMAFFVHVSWLSATNWWQFFVFLMPQGLLLFVVYAGTYFINLRTLKVDLEPRRIELLMLLSSLSDEKFDSAETKLHKLSSGIAAPIAIHKNAVPRGIVLGAKVAVVTLAGLLVFVGPLFDIAIRFTESRDNALARNGGCIFPTVSGIDRPTAKKE